MIRKYSIEKPEILDGDAVIRLILWESKSRNEVPLFWTVSEIYEFPADHDRNELAVIGDKWINDSPAETEFIAVNDFFEHLGGYIDGGIITRTMLDLFIENCTDAEDQSGISRDAVFSTHEELRAAFENYIKFAVSMSMEHK